MYNPFSLSGKTILVTGASSGIGRATAIECAKMGAVVFLTARDEARLRETLDALEGEGHQYIIADLTREEDTRQLVEQLPQLDGVVLNAGIAGLIPVQAISAAKLQEMQLINLNAPILLTCSLVKKRKLNNPSSIVFTSSAAGVFRTSAGNAIYATTKCGIDAFMRTAALEFAGKGIRCNSVNPAMVETELIKNLPVNEEEREKNLARYPLHRYGKPEEIAYAIVYLLSDASSWTTGTALKLDGGLTLS
jgi:NAD(P)-dependent dehydrogenase (short-subunit alcohol dehydrogenase family)